MELDLIKALRMSGLTMNDITLVVMPFPQMNAALLRARRRGDGARRCVLRRAAGEFVSIVGPSGCGKSSWP